MAVQKILDDFKNRKFKPVYLFHGEESYFIDELVDYAEAYILNDSEKSFNQTIVYGKDIDFVDLLQIVKRYPMMSDYQVVIVKEAQNMKWNTLKAGDHWENYLESPLLSTLLIFAYKNGKFDNRKKIFKQISKVGEVFESKPIRENELFAWLNTYVNDRGFKIDVHAQRLLGEFLGLQLSRIANELDKLMINIPKGSEIDVASIQKYVGINKDFNVFEYQKALVNRDVLKANQISAYFSASPKDHPFPAIVANLNNFFSKVLKYHLLADKKQAASVLGVPPFILREYEQAARVYSVGKLIYVVSVLRIFDLKSKGVEVSSKYTLEDMWKEFTFQIIH